MKKILSICIALFTALSCLSLYACGEDEQIPETVEDKNYSVIAEDISLINGQRYDLDVVLLEDGKICNNAEFSYTVDDGEIASIENGTVIAKKLGETEITVEASVNGKKVSESKKFKCSVNVDAGIAVNKHEYILFLKNSVKGVDFITDDALIAKAYSDGKEIDDEITWESENPEIAKVEAGMVFSVSIGETKLIGKCVDEKYGELKASVAVEVRTAIVSTEENLTVDLNKERQEIDADKILGTGYSVGKIVNADTRKETAVSINSFRTEGFSVGEYRYLVYEKNGVFACEVNLIAADFVIYKNSDLFEIYKHWNASYIVLDSDIKLAGTFTVPTEFVIGGSVFSGTFNGLGHSVTGMTIDSNATGLFCQVSNAVFKNVCLDDINLNRSNSGALFYRSAGIISIDNVYIGISKMNNGESYTGGAFGFCFNGKIVFNNCIIKNYSMSAANESMGAVVGRCGGMIEYNDTFVLSDGIACGTTFTSSNHNFNCDTVNSKTIIYPSVESFTAEKSSLDFSGFKDFWDLSKEVPSFK